MTDETTQDLIDALDALLDKERGALLSGDIDAMNRQADLKEALIGKLNVLTDLPQSSLNPLHQKLRRNQALIDGALEGIRAVAARMAEMRSIRRGLQTYDKSGAIREIKAEVRHKVEKRA